MEREPVAMATKMIVSVFLGGFLMFLLYLYECLFLKPERLRSKFEKQGIRGPSPSIFLGNIPEIKKIHLKLQCSSSSTTAKPAHDHDQPSSNSLIPVLAHDWPSTILSHLYQWQSQYGTLYINLYNKFFYY